MTTTAVPYGQIPSNVRRPQIQRVVSLVPFAEWACGGGLVPQHLRPLLSQQKVRLPDGELQGVANGVLGEVDIVNTIGQFARQPNLYESGAIFHVGARYTQGALHRYV
jgi:hypothetical protein